MANEHKKEKKIIRIASTDLDSSLSVINALRRIKGIGFMLANAICKKLEIDQRAKLSDLKEEEINRIENAIKNPDLPRWLLNRRKDRVTGKDTHLIGGELELKVKEDIGFLRKIRCYRGIRHEMGLPVRGQRTGGKSFRKGRTVGVSKKKSMPAKKPEKK
jgi:small subunit ribosomal protein S13